ncbi:MAG: permease prefix domain 1-containing protein [Candidatus Izemoplasma sp.]
MKQIENFVKNVFKVIPKDYKKDEIIESVTLSLNEKVEDLIETGLDETEAIDKTVMEFGTVEDYFVDFNKKAKKERRIKTINHYKNDLMFSVLGTIIIIGILATINFTYTTDKLWFFIPSIAVLWWPLALLYRLLNKRGDK